MTHIYAYKNTEEEVMRSSSGGAFIRLCREFEEIHGKENVAFYGVVLDENMEVKHMRANSAEQCHIFQGSKYVKSDFLNCRQEIMDDLTDGKWVLFSGTPCQVYSVINYFSKKNLTDRLFTIDIICHGTAKKEVWESYISWIEKMYGGKLISYSFRYKPEGWKAYPGYAKFDNGIELINTPETSVFSKLHLKAYSIEKGCFKCPFARQKRNSDCTLGDYWGIENTDTPIVKKETGVSLILANSERGQILVQGIFDKTKKMGDYIIETFDHKYLDHQHNLNKPTEIPNDYDIFWDDYVNASFEEIISKYLHWGIKYRVQFKIKKLVRKTPLISIYRKVRKRV